MDFLKKNYEKVILSLVLLGLLAATLQLLFQISSERQRLEELTQMDVSRENKELQPFDLSTNETVLRRLRRPDPVILSGDHNLFNPVKWTRRSESVRKETAVLEGAPALVIDGLKPLKTIISYEGTSPMGKDVAHSFRVTREADRERSNRLPKMYQTLPIPGMQNEVFVLRELRPDSKNPTEFVLELRDDKSVVVVSKEKPYEAVAGYLADLKYPPENLSFVGKRVDEKLTFGGDTNNIVAITSTNVTVEALSNRKRTTISIKAASGAAPVGR